MKPTQEHSVDPKLVDLILSNVADGVFTVDQELRITFFNRAAEELTGFRSAEAVGRRCYEVFRTPLCPRDCPMRQSIRTSETVKNFEIDILTRKGSRQTVSVSTAPLFDFDGNVLGGVETFRDVTPMKRLQRELKAKHTLHDIVCKSARMREVVETLAHIARSDATVMLEGRTGTGKDLLATAIHNISPRSEGPLVKVSCGALPEAVLESELFGYVKGAFPGATGDLVGRLQAAAEGTLFLDEIAAVPSALQEKLAHALESRSFVPLGSKRAVTFDARVVASTKHDPHQLVKEGRLRRDLYHHLNVVAVRIPELLERTEDIPLLAEHFVERLNYRLGRNIEGVSDEAVAVLLRYPFVGNVRELESALEHAYIVAQDRKIVPEDLPPTVRDAAGASGSLEPARPGAPWGRVDPAEERQRLIACLERNQGSIPRAARELGMHRTTLWRKVKRLDIDMP